VVILHASDLQVGKPYRPRTAEALLSLARERTPDLIVVAGDLTQRAKVREYRTARALLDRLGDVAPVVVTPGNHDVPLYRIWERLLTPYRNWRRWIGPDLDTVTRIPGATVVALSSAAPRRAIVAGRLSASQVDFARRAFAAAAGGDARVVVTHHHFVPTPDHEGGRTLPHASAILKAFEGMGVELVLGGHVHQTHLQTSRARVPGEGAGIPLVACGTTTSVRGRGPEAGRNTLNVVSLDARTVEVVTHRYEADRDAFVAAATRSFTRRERGAGRPTAVEERSP
jgi:3',5'-cyclic AMP phosphodiesterase CpdA